MTKQRDLKRMVRERQARTGESYVTALRHIRGEPRATIPVVEFIDLSEIAAALGIKCRVMTHAAVAERIDVSAMLVQLRTLLVATARDRDLDLMRSVVVHGERPLIRHPGVAEGRTFMTRFRAGLGGICETGSMLSFAVAGRQAAELLVFLLMPRPATYIRWPPALIIASSLEHLFIYEATLAEVRRSPRAR